MRILPLCLVVFLATTPTSAVEAEVDYRRDIKPILQAKCVACHGAIRQKAGLRLDAAPLVRKGGRNGPLFVAGKPEGSLLLDAVLGHDRPRMPPEHEGEALPAAEIALLRAWITQGAKLPNEPIPADPHKHWAFQSPIRPTIPTVPSVNPIDAFLAAERTRAGTTPGSPADRSTLLRRATLDLIGTPPTLEELHAFLADPRPDAYERIVERLLADPRHGERWGRHWMDVWRYSDPFGLGEEYRYSQRHIWRWRDWIIESLNADAGYDRMVREMLAGDEIAPTDRNTLRATGYLARNWYKFNRNVWIADTVEYTSASFLGLTFRCARCHDHKYDPISHQDYYQLRAFFEPHDVRIDPVPGETNLTKDGVARAFDAKPDAPTYLFRRGDERQPDQSRPLAPALPAFLGGPELVVPPVVGSTGRRLALANWITDRTNPLTARVAVNHIWMRHFGVPLAPNPANFGLAGGKPSHPELLDWLAVEFMESGWSMKRLHRLMVTSDAYRRSSAPLSGNLKIDPENHTLWRMNPRRMEAEVVRDSLLALTGHLDPTMGGPILDEKLGQSSRRRSVYFRFNTEYKMGLLEPFDPASPTECYRRHESVVPQQALALFNSALALNQSRRLAKQLGDRSPQVFVVAAYETVLGRIPTADEHRRCQEFLAEQAGLYVKPTTSFPAVPGEVLPASSDPAQRAREDLIQVLLNHNDFVTIR